MADTYTITETRPIQPAPRERKLPDVIEAFIAALDFGDQAVVVRRIAHTAFLLGILEGIEGRP